METKTIRVYLVAYAAVDVEVELDEYGKYDDSKLTNKAVNQARKEVSNQVEWMYDSEEVLDA